MNIIVRTFMICALFCRMPGQNQSPKKEAVGLLWNANVSTRAVYIRCRCIAKEHCRGIGSMKQTKMPVVAPAKPDHLSVEAGEAKQWT